MGGVQDRLADAGRTGPQVGHDPLPVPAYLDFAQLARNVTAAHERFLDVTSRLIDAAADAARNRKNWLILGPIAAVAASIVMAVATVQINHCGPLAGSAAPWGP